MAAGDIELYSAPADNATAIAAVLSSSGVVVADKITAHVANGTVFYTVIKAA
jgi:hypothetical protein